MHNNNSGSFTEIMLKSSASIRKAIETLDKTSMKVILVLDEQERFLGTLTDGDIRRALLAGTSLEDKICKIYCSDSIIVGKEATISAVKNLMHQYKLSHIPIIDSNRSIIGLHVLEEIVTAPRVENRLVIMAGGLGVRLRPHTATSPKPMLKVGDRPILQHIIDKAKQQGFYNFILITNYLHEVIYEHFGDGSANDIKITYVRENSPMGTAGSIAQLSDVIDSPFVVTNGDVLSDIGYDDLLSFHTRHGEIATMAVKLHQMKNPYGVVKIDKDSVVGIQEKPIYSDYVNAGIYVFNPEVIKFLIHGERLDMTELFERLIERSQRVLPYIMDHAWMDIGRPEDLKEANLLADRMNEN